MEGRGRGGPCYSDLVCGDVVRSCPDAASSSRWLRTNPVILDIRLRNLRSLKMITWTEITSPGQYASAMWLMQDGSVLANLFGSTALSVLRPDSSGSYATGTWTPAGNLLLERQYYGSAVFSDGRVVICGG